MVKIRAGVFSLKFFKTKYVVSLFAIPAKFICVFLWPFLKLIIESNASHLMFTDLKRI